MERDVMNKSRHEKEMSRKRDAKEQECQDKGTRMKRDVKSKREQKKAMSRDRDVKRSFVQRAAGLTHILFADIFSCIQARKIKV